MGKRIFSFQFSHLIDGFLDFRFLSFSAGEDEVSTERPDELQLLPQAVRLRLDGLVDTTRNLSFNKYGATLQRV